jgi:membrane protease subunit HflK
VLLVGYLLTAFDVVGPGEVVVVRRLGRTLVRPWTAGLQVGWPWGLEQRLRVRVDEVRRLAIGTARGEAPGSHSGRGEYLTGDRNLALVGAVVQYRVSQPVEYVAASANREGLLSDLADTAVARACARLAIDDLLRNRRQQFSDDVQASLAREFQDLGLGVEVLSVSVVEARPPDEVAAEFADAQAARSDRERRATEGNTEAARIDLAARSRAAAVVEHARSGAARTRGAARGRADRFLALLDQAKVDPQLTRWRLYVNAIERGFQRLGRRIVLQPGQSIDLSVLGVR